MDRISRRGFLQGVGVTAAALAAAGGTQALLQRAERAQGTAPRGSAAAAAPLIEAQVKTTCALCPSGCGLDVRVVDGRAVKVEGNPLHPVNQGACCLRGQASLEVLYSPERLAHPRLQTGARGSGDWREISWDEALRLVAERLAALRAAGQAHTVAFLYGQPRGQMRGLIERFMAAYGSPNAIPLLSPDEQAARLAMFCAQGINGLPVYDLPNARYVLAFGGNLLESSRHTMAALAGAAFMHRGRPDRGKLVAVHPRLGLTAVKADEWVPIRPGTYGALALGLANVIVNSGLYDRDFVLDFAFGFEDFQDAEGRAHQGFRSLVLEQYSLERVSAITGVSTADIARLAGEFATNRPALAVLPDDPGGPGGSQSFYTAFAVYALNALVGNIDQAGGVLVQRYPALATWPDFRPDAASLDSLARPRIDAAGSSGLPGALSAWQDLPARLLAGQPYPANAVFLYQANPVYQSPQAGGFAQALLKAPFVVSFATTLDESAAHADLVLPSGTFLETWGDDYVEGTGHAGISLRQPVVAPVHDTLDAGDVLLRLAGLLGGPPAEALPWRTYRELVAYRLAGSDVDSGRLAENGVWSELAYFNAEPGSRAWGEVVGRDRLNAPHDGRFDFFARELLAVATPDRDEAGDLSYLPHFAAPAAAEAQGASETYPLYLAGQGLITDTPGWQGIIPTLQECYGLQAGSRWQSWVEISPRAAQGLGVQNGDLVWVESPAGRVEAAVKIYAGLWPDAVFLPPGQGHYSRVRWGRDAGANGQVGANANALAAPGAVTRVRITRA